MDIPERSPAAQRNYLLLHSGISEHDHRRSALHRYLTDLGDAGDLDFDLLQIAAVSYLKSLDELHDDRAARLAADQELAKRAHSRGAHPNIETSGANTRAKEPA